MSDRYVAMPEGLTLRLTAIEGPVTGQTFTPSSGGVFLIGRSTRAQFVLPSGPQGDLRISHTHCLIECDPPLCRVHDLDSSNGTFINGESISSGDLREGDQLRIGRTTLRIELTAPHEREANGPASVSLPEPLPAPLPHARVACPICRRSKKHIADDLCPKCQSKADALPQIVPGYRLIREIGKGDLGTVYIAFGMKLGRAVAVKTIDLAMAPSPEQWGRFARAAEVLMRFRHRQMASYHEVGQAGHKLFVAADFVPGIDTGDLLRKGGALQVQAAVRLVCQLLSALNYGHAFGLVHGDVKPTNLLIKIRGESKTLKVADFGLKRIIQESQLRGPTLLSDFIGATAFMAPERVLHCRDATVASDQYSAAATLYFLLTRKCVYDQPKRVPRQLAQILNEEVVPIRERRYDVPPKLIGIIHRALSRDPSRRFPDVAAFKKELLPFTKA